MGGASSISIMCADLTRSDVSSKTPTSNPSKAPNSPARRPDGRLDLWVCSRCGYVYDGNSGEALTGSPPATPFESLPEAWRCPHCTAEKDYFFH